MTKTEKIIFDNLELIENLRLSGVSIRRIAEILEISEKQLLRISNKHIEVARVLRRTGEILIANIDGSLYKSAIGYHYEEYIIADNGSITTLKKYKPGNVAAMSTYRANLKKHTDKMAENELRLMELKIREQELKNEQLLEENKRMKGESEVQQALIERLSTVTQLATSGIAINGAEIITPSFNVEDIVREYSEEPEGE